MSGGEVRWRATAIGSVLGLVGRGSGERPAAGGSKLWRARMDDIPDGLGKLFPDSRLRVLVGQNKSNVGWAVLLCN